MNKQLTHISLDTAERLEKELRGKSPEEALPIILKHYQENARRTNKAFLEMQRSQQDAGTTNVVVRISSGGGASAPTTPTSIREGEVDVATPGVVTVYFEPVGTTNYFPKAPYIITYDAAEGYLITFCVPILVPTDSRKYNSFDIYAPITGKLVWSF